MLLLNSYASSQYCGKHFVDSHIPTDFQLMTNRAPDQQLQMSRNQPQGQGHQRELLALQVYNQPVDPVLQLGQVQSANHH